MNARRVRARERRVITATVLLAALILVGLFAAGGDVVPMLWAGPPLAQMVGSVAAVLLAATAFGTVLLAETIICRALRRLRDPEDEGSIHLL